jgi:hypothetical protein
MINKLIEFETGLHGQRGKPVKPTTAPSLARQEDKGRKRLKAVRLAKAFTETWRKVWLPAAPDGGPICSASSLGSSLAAAYDRGDRSLNGPSVTINGPSVTMPMLAAPPSSSNRSRSIASRVSRSRATLNHFEARSGCCVVQGSEHSLREQRTREQFHGFFSDLSS